MTTPHSLIVGGSKGLGAALARRWAAAGHKVSVIARSEPAAADRIAGVQTWAASATDGAAVKTAVGAIVAKNGPINNLVFFQRFRGSEDAWHGVTEVAARRKPKFIGR